MLRKIETFALLNNLHQLRENERIKIAVLADRIGVSRQAIYEIENKKRVPSLLTAFKIAWYFDKNVEEIFKFYVDETTDDSGFT